MDMIGAIGTLLDWAAQYNAAQARVESSVCSNGLY